MSFEMLALIELVVLISTFAVSLAAARRILTGKPTVGRAAATVMVWTGLFGSLPYLVFVASHRYLPRGELGTVPGFLLGSLPLAMLSAPVIGLVMVLRHLARHLQMPDPHFAPGHPQTDIPLQDRPTGTHEPEDDRGSGATARPSTATDRAASSGVRC